MKQGLLKEIGWPPKYLILLHLSQNGKENNHNCFLHGVLNYNQLYRMSLVVWKKSLEIIEHSGSSQVLILWFQSVLQTICCKHWTVPMSLYARQISMCLADMNTYLILGAVAVPMASLSF